MEDDGLKRRFFPEANISGFSHVDGTLSFYNQIAATVGPDDVILDFGAGRGELFLDDEVPYRRNIGNFKGRCREVDGCDIDPVVLENPFLDDAKIIRIDEPLPYEDNRFDVIIARYVFEHIANPKFVARELLRILKPGGYIAATTPNKWGYIGVAARMVPSRHHVQVLSHSQPERKPEDVFPTTYLLNTRTALSEAFGEEAEIYLVRKASEPDYHFGRPWMYRVIKFVNKHAPDAVLPMLDIYVRKPVR
ncbi:class I SAM-dependent methyltransferase [Mycolicibacterium sp.]|uniref:class I SAM-dependent methyltransferase n=1 Tax=Mycolicibacterium sp. TaxID=2320850 RepID=UPI0028AFB937|nr:class I SAM-dependent methyltransferase [Mycolicibacterium sp.]